MRLPKGAMACFVSILFEGDMTCYASLDYS